MGCSNCGTSHNGLPAGCKNNGVCGTYGCNKLDVFDWLAGTPIPDQQKPFDIVEVRFKNSRKGFYRSNNLELQVGSVVAVEASPGYDMGIVSLTGELVRLQLQRKGVKDNYEIKKVFRIAKQEDIDRWQEARKLEQATMIRARERATGLGLQMKISDVEYQGDRTRVTFYYTADDRVDFRELIRAYAEEFKVRIEMRQIGYRAEAGRLGGIGSCGRELCCSTWLTDFRSVSTSAARYQQLSLNPAKLAGQCGKLKCCLNYELDQYLEAFRDFPSTNVKLLLERGTAIHFKTDVFRRLFYYIIDGQGTGPFALTVDAVKEIISQNRKGIKVGDVAEFVEEQIAPEEDSMYTNVVGQDSLTRFDQSRRKKKKGRDQSKGRPPGAPEQRQNRPPQSGQPGGQNRQGQAPKGDRPPRRNQPKGNRPPQQGPRPERKPQQPGQRPRPPKKDNPGPDQPQ